MQAVFTALMLFLTIWCHAQGLRVTADAPDPDGESRYRIQVGSYSDAAGAQWAFERLQQAGLSPALESHPPFTRVVLPNISMRHVPFLTVLLRGSGFADIWVRDEPKQTSFSVIVSGGAVAEIVPSGNTQPLRIVQTIPSFMAEAVIENTYQANAPLVFFLSEPVFLGSLAGNIEVSANGTPVNGTLMINEGAGGEAVLTFTPDSLLPAGAQIAVTMKQGLQDASGNFMASDVHLAYTAEQGSETAFARSNFGFEQGADGAVFAGDGAISGGRGPLQPFEGERYAAASTGARIVSDDGAAIGGASSQIQLGPIMEPFSALSFYYNFISAEFNEYVGSQFDDTAMLTIYGPRGARNEIITSVNRIAFDNQRFSGYPNMPDTGDAYAGGTGWLPFSVENINVGFPAYIIFTVTDVGDTSYSSILAIDAIDLR